MESQYEEGVGRWWGVLHRENLPWADKVELQIKEKQANQLLRVMRRFAKLKPRHYPSLTIFCDAKFWLDRIDALAPGEE